MQVVLLSFHFNIITGGNLAMNDNQIRFRGNGDQNHRINYTNENGLDGLHIQGNRGVEIATEFDGTVMTVRDGKVGIGTGSPVNLLHVNGSFLIKKTGPAIKIENAESNHKWEWYTGGGVTNTGLGLYDRTNGMYLIAFDDNQNVGIGTYNPEYKLDVRGKIRSDNEVLVKTADFPDFVFDKDYSMQAFGNRISTIKKQKHLPYIASAEEIEENGLPVSETMSGLTRNVEELYLYIEKLEKRIAELEDKAQKDQTN